MNIMLWAITILAGGFAVMKLVEWFKNSVHMVEEKNISELDRWADMIIAGELSKRLETDPVETALLLKRGDDPEFKRAAEENLGAIVVRFIRKKDRYRVCLLELVPGSTRALQWERSISRDDLPSGVREQFLTTGENSICHPWVLPWAA